MTGQQRALVKRSLQTAGWAYFFIWVLNLVILFRGFGLANPLTFDLTILAGSIVFAVKMSVELLVLVWPASLALLGFLVWRYVQAGRVGAPN